MAHVTGPLHSQTASGQYGKSVIYQTYGGRTYAKKYAVPGNTPGSDKMNQTNAQLNVQATIKLLMEHWTTIEKAEQKSWEVLATPAGYAPVNAYTKENFKRIASGQSITNVWPAAEPNANPANVIVGHVGAINPSPNCQGTYIFREYDSDGNPVWEMYRAPLLHFILWPDRNGGNWIIQRWAEELYQDTVERWSYDEQSLSWYPSGDFTGQPLTDHTLPEVLGQHI